MKIYIHDDSIEKRKNDLLKGYETNLGIEGRTNLRIIVGTKENKIYFRIDCQGRFDCTLSNKSISYLEKEHKAINELNKLYGFDKATFEDIDNILEITKDMTARFKNDW